MLRLAASLGLTLRERNALLLAARTTFATAVDVTVAELHLEAFLPLDEESAAILRAR
ncbi:hypothetical protein ACFYZB_38370 [Streptomyces sp. NPDC001852]|uniref:hypothetical protein n=1 Tax=Streptomyces sp. NPDC001852 TaxID=3364619 RepID=UPI0036C7F125